MFNGTTDFQQCSTMMPNTRSTSKTETRQRAPRSDADNPPPEGGYASAMGACVTEPLWRVRVSILLRFIVGVVAVGGRRRGGQRQRRREMAAEGPPGTREPTRFWKRRRGGGKSRSKMRPPDLDAGAESRNQCGEAEANFWITVGHKRPNNGPGDRHFRQRRY